MSDRPCEDPDNNESQENQPKDSSSKQSTIRQEKSSLNDESQLEREEPFQKKKKIKTNGHSSEQEQSNSSNNQETTKSSEGNRDSDDGIPNFKSESNLTRKVMRSRQIHSKLLNKRNRWKPSEKELTILKDYFDVSKYPSKEDKEWLKDKLKREAKSSLSIEQISRWFQHEREKNVRLGNKSAIKNVYKKFSRLDLDYLKDQFEQNTYPKTDEMKEISKKLKVSLSKIENWYKHNRRSLAKKGNFQLKTKKYFKKEEVNYLLRMFDLYPRPTKDQFIEMSEQLQCTDAQIKNWYSNRRKKQKLLAKRKKNLSQDQIDQGFGIEGNQEKGTIPSFAQIQQETQQAQALQNNAAQVPASQGQFNGNVQNNPGQGLIQQQQQQFIQPNVIQVAPQQMKPEVQPQYISNFPVVQRANQPIQIPPTLIQGNQQPQNQPQYIVVNPQQQSQSQLPNNMIFNNNNNVPTVNQNSVIIPERQEVIQPKTNNNQNNNQIMQQEESKGNFSIIFPQNKPNWPQAEGSNDDSDQANGNGKSGSNKTSNGSGSGNNGKSGSNKTSNNSGNGNGTSSNERISSSHHGPKINSNIQFQEATTTPQIKYQVANPSIGTPLQQQQQPQQNQQFMMAANQGGQIGWINQQTPQPSYPMQVQPIIVVPNGNQNEQIKPYEQQPHQPQPYYVFPSVISFGGGNAPQNPGAQILASSPKQQSINEKPQQQQQQQQQQYYVQQPNVIQQGRVQGYDQPMQIQYLTSLYAPYSNNNIFSTYYPSNQSNTSSSFVLNTSANQQPQAPQIISEPQQQQQQQQPVLLMPQKVAIPQQQLQQNVVMGTEQDQVNRMNPSQRGQ